MMNPLYSEKSFHVVSDHVFSNPFQLEDLLVFDPQTLSDLLADDLRDLSVNDLAIAFHDAPEALVRLVRQALPEEHRARFAERQRLRALAPEVAARRRRILDGLFWELTYWKTPEWYEELTEGERLHPGIFRRLRADLHDRVVLDAGAGSGRATLDTLRAGARHIYAIDPSPGLLRILEQKAEAQHLKGRVTPLRGRFDALPLPNDSVDVTLSCSAFTADDGDEARRGLNEMRRVTRSGGKIVLIWPRPTDLAWLKRQGFTHEALPMQGEMQVHFRSLGSARRVVQRFYAHNEAAQQYLRQHPEPAIPFSVLGMQPPCDYVWTVVQK
ncbi:MAG: class I SAM-dependent methyltransferase [Ktedonobacterales bacterium]|nr:class I SAM-dependent methyltransferase [Ktedonobacterales bacterium]